MGVSKLLHSGVEPVKFVQAWVGIVVSRGVELGPKQFWMAGAGATNFRWWSRSLKFGFRFHRYSFWAKRVIQIIRFF